MRPHVIIITLAVLGILAALPLGKATGHNAGASSPWPCCDNCGVCNKKQPTACQCKDISVQGCHPECKNCVKLAATIPPGGPGPVVTYRCADMLTNFCQRNCTPAVVASVLTGGVF